MVCSIATMVKYWDRLKPEMDNAEPRLDITGLADALKISFQAVAKVRDGGSFGSQNNLKAAKLFGLNPEWLATGKGQKYANQPDLVTMARMPEGSYNVTAIDVKLAVQKVAEHLESLPGYDIATAISLFSILANSPDQHDIVAAGLMRLKPEARGAPSKQESPAKITDRAA